MIELMGGSPVPMSAGETYSSLQQGIVDGAENTELVLTVDGHQDLVKPIHTQNINIHRIFISSVQNLEPLN